MTTMTDEEIDELETDSPCGFKWGACDIADDKHECDLDVNHSDLHHCGYCDEEVAT
jgi:hypothetical protein